MGDVDLRLLQALRDHHLPVVSGPVTTQTESNKLSDLANAVSELTTLLRSSGQVTLENISQQNGHQAQSRVNRPQTSQFEVTLQLDVNSHNPDEILETLRDQMGDASFAELLQSGLSGAGPVPERSQGEHGTQNNSYLQGSENSAIAQHSHDDDLAEIQRVIEALSQPGTRASSPPERGPASISEYSETSPARHASGPFREDSQSMSPAPYGSNSQMLDSMNLAGMSQAQIHWWAQNRMVRARQSIGNNSRVRQEDPCEDPAKAAERERVRGENRVRKKRWRESNQDRNKDNDLRCRVTKRATKIWGVLDCAEKTAWMKQEFLRRRAKREAKMKARTTDENGPNIGGGSSSVFQAFASSPPPPMLGTSASPISNSFQTPYVDSRADETRMALQDLVSLLHPSGARPQNPETMTSQDHPTESSNSGQGRENDSQGRRSESHQPIEIQSLIPATNCSHNDGNEIPGLEGITWPLTEEDPFTEPNASSSCIQFKDIIANLGQKLKANQASRPSETGEAIKEAPGLIAPFHWPAPVEDENAFVETNEIKPEPPEQPQPEVSIPQDETVVSAAAPQQGLKSVIEKLSDSDIDGLIPMNEDGEPDLNEEALERLIAESGLGMDELLSSTLEQQATTRSEETPQQSVPQDRQRYIAALGGDGVEVSMSLEQINALLGDLTGSVEIDEPRSPSSSQSTNLAPFDQAMDLTRDTIASLSQTWRNRQYPAPSPIDTTSRGTKRCSPGSSSSPSPSKRICKPPPFHNPLILTQQLHAMLQSSSSDPTQPPQRHHHHQVTSSYAASFGNSDNMNKRLMKPPPYRPKSKFPSVGLATSIGSAAANHVKSNEHEKKIKSMGFPPLMAGMKPK